LTLLNHAAAQRADHLRVLAPTLSRPMLHHVEYVARIVYASQATIGHAVYTEMEQIRESALRHNEPLRISTALLYQSGWFVQWKEGPSDAIIRLMNRVSVDPRHHSMQIIHSSHGPRLLAGPWSMAIVQCDDDDDEDMAERVARLRQSLVTGVQYGPAAIWRQISTPMQNPGALRQANPDAFQRVMVCAAEGAAPFELVRWLGKRYAQKVVHRRFAGAKDLDVGTDLVDFQDGDHATRVIAMARNGLLLPLTRAFMSDYSHLVLLLSGDRQHDMSLVHRVSEACAGMHTPPVLVGIASHASHHVEPFAAARRQRLVYLERVADPEACVGVWTAVASLLAKWREAAHSGSAG
jgi:hypothetical protein